MRYLNVAAEGCGCKSSTLPLTTAAVVQTFILLIDALVAARSAFDWSIPPSTSPSEQDLHDGDTTPPDPT